MQTSRDDSLSLSDLKQWDATDPSNDIGNDNVRRPLQTLSPNRSRLLKASPSKVSASKRASVLFQDAENHEEQIQTSIFSSCTSNSTSPRKSDRNYKLFGYDFVLPDTLPLEQPEFSRPSNTEGNNQLPDPLNVNVDQVQQATNRETDSQVEHSPAVLDISDFIFASPQKPQTSSPLPVPTSLNSEHPTDAHAAFKANVERMARTNAQNFQLKPLPMIRTLSEARFDSAPHALTSLAYNVNHESRSVENSTIAKPNSIEKELVHKAYQGYVPILPALFKMPDHVKPSIVSPNILKMSAHETSIAQMPQPQKFDHPTAQADSAAPPALPTKSPRIKLSTAVNPARKGRKTLKLVAFCPKCDRGFTTEGRLTRHENTLACERDSKAKQRRVVVPKSPIDSPSSSLDAEGEADDVEASAFIANSNMSGSYATAEFTSNPDSSTFSRPAAPSAPSPWRSCIDSTLTHYKGYEESGGRVTLSQFGQYLPPVVDPDAFAPNQYTSTFDASWWSDY